MAELHRDELFRLAELTALKLSDQEADDLLVDLRNLINYTDELMAVDLKPERPVIGAVNVLRSDAIAPSNTSSELLAQAPQTDDAYFVVPQIIDDKESA